MIVYGDHIRFESARNKLERIDDLLRQASLLGAGLERHGLLVAALIEAGELAQGFADARFAERGQDEPDVLDHRLMALTCRLAGVAGRSWDTGFANFGPIPTYESLAAIGLPSATLPIKQPEGFAHYAVYPEAYWQAAKGLGPRPSARVIGIRSIGTTLSAMVSAALEAEPAVSVRPTGHPFTRMLALGPSLESGLSPAPQVLHAVVDEGPGLSGSSFSAVAESLEARGVSPENIVFFPSHRGDIGNQACDRARHRWSRARRLCQTFQDFSGARAPAAHRIEAWAADLIGAPIEPPQDLSGGLWRQHLLPHNHSWPPVDAQNEKLKFLITTAGGRFLLRFAGLGRIGLHKLDMAQRLGIAGFCIAPLGWRHGFLVEPWRDDCLPATPTGFTRDGFLRRAGSYLSFRADAFPAPPESGASLEALLDMIKINTAEDSSVGIGPAVQRWARRLPHLEPKLNRIATDGRLAPWEWLQAPDGALLKTDALDHHVAHDLIGCQPVEWDIAGAFNEWNLSPNELGHVCEHVSSMMGKAPSQTLLSFFRLAYPAFQIGAAHLALGRAHPDEQPRLNIRLTDCRSMLMRAVTQDA